MLIPHRTRLPLVATISVSLVLLFTLTNNLHTSNALANSLQQERQLEVSMPTHIPLRVKIKKEKEKEFKDLNNERWARDFELEITNIGDKPIYSLTFGLVLDVKDSSGQNVISNLSYGRWELADHRVRATPDDVPLKPGESVVLTIHPGQVAAWDYMRQTENRPYPKKVTVKYKNISFGDGTGLMGPAGTPVPRKIPGRSKLDRCGPQQDRSTSRALEWLVTARGSTLIRSTGVELPANFLPVNFLSTGVSKMASMKPEPEPEDCCPYGCTSTIYAQRVTCYGCPASRRSDSYRLLRS